MRLGLGIRWGTTRFQWRLFSNRMSINLSHLKQIQWRNLRLQGAASHPSARLPEDYHIVRWAHWAIQQPAATLIFLFVILWLGNTHLKRVYLTMRRTWNSKNGLYIYHGTQSQGAYDTNLHPIRRKRHFLLNNKIGCAPRWCRTLSTWSGNWCQNWFQRRPNSNNMNLL